MAMATRSRISLAAVAAFAVVAAACGSGTEPTAINLGGTDTEAAPAAPAVPSETTSPADGGAAETTPPGTETARQRPDGPDAPDFTLALSGPGGTFSLSDEARPVFMVFWAEW